MNTTKHIQRWIYDINKSTRLLDFLNESCFTDHGPFFLTCLCETIVVWGLWFSSFKWWYDVSWECSRMYLKLWTIHIDEPILLQLSGIAYRVTAVATRQGTKQNLNCASMFQSLTQKCEEIIFAFPISTLVLKPRMIPNQQTAWARSSSPFEGSSTERNDNR